jgi:hypothetical protein
VKHDQVTLPRPYQLCGERSCVWAAALADVTCCFARFGREGHQNTALLADGDETFSAASTLQRVAAGVQHKVVGRVWCLATQDCEDLALLDTLHASKTVEGSSTSVGIR